MVPTTLGGLRQAADEALRIQDFPEARRCYLELRARLVTTFGPKNSYVVRVDETLGGILRALGDLGAAREAFERARSVSSSPLLETVLAHLDPLDASTLAARPRVVIEHEKVSRTVENDSFYIGRGIELVHLYIPNIVLSRVHCRVLWEGGRWFFEDCGSENGSYLGGARVERRAIGDGDSYVLGRSEVTVRISVGS